MGNTVGESVTSRGAAFSEDHVYRYRLTRAWKGGRGRLVIIGLNPSTADENVDDPTIRREIVFGQKWGFACLDKLNIYALRSTDPVKLYTHPAPIGPLNDEFILGATYDAEMVLCAWGVHGAFMERGRCVRDLLSSRIVHVLGLTKDGHPKHPLYIKGDSLPEVWSK